jgi:ABC-type branched-subunit amino acid transport system substrate-binding protein
VIGGDALTNWSELDRGEGDWDGVRYVDYFDLGGSGALADFLQRYQERFGRPAGTPEVLSYDATRLLLAAIRDGARTGEAVRSWIASLGAERPPLEGLSGPIAFDANGDIARSYVLITIVAPPR